MMPGRWSIPALCVAGALLLLAATTGRAEPPRVTTIQRGGTYEEPPARVDPLYLPRGPDRPGDPDTSDSVLTLRLAVDYPLRRSDQPAAGLGAQGALAQSPTLQAFVRAQVPGSGWFAQAQFFRYLHRDEQRPWNPDFTYGFGYERFEADTWRLAYENYTGTRFRPDHAAGESRFHFPQGQWSAGRRFGLGETLEEWFLVGDGDQASCLVQAHWTARYTDLASGGTRSGKKAASLGCRYSRPEGWFAHLTLYGYPDRAQQQPWDPDYTWGFGWAEPPPGGLALQYGNYSGNRFPGRARGPGEGRFNSGSVTLSWTRQW